MIERATIYRDGDRRWHWRFSRGRAAVGDSSRSAGFVHKRHAIAGLEHITGGIVDLTFRSFTKKHGLYQQGTLTRLVKPADSRLEPYEDKIFVEVIG